MKPIWRILRRVSVLSVASMAPCILCASFIVRAIFAALIRILSFAHWTARHVCLKFLMNLKISDSHARWNLHLMAALMISGVDIFYRGIRLPSFGFHVEFRSRVVERGSEEPGSDQD